MACPYRAVIVAFFALWLPACLPFAVGAVRYALRELPPTQRAVQYPMRSSSSTLPATMTIQSCLRDEPIRMGVSSLLPPSRPVVTIRGSLFAQAAIETQRSRSPPSRQTHLR